MKRKCVVIYAGIVFLAGALIVVPSTFAATASRAAVISSELNCLQQNINNPHVSWPGVCSMPSVPKAVSSSTADRSAAVSREMNCVDQNMNNPNVQWSDVCYANLEPSSGMTMAQRIDSHLNKLLQRSNPLTKLEFGYEHYGYRYEEPNFAKLKSYNFNGIFFAYTYRTSNNKYIHSLKDIFSDSNKVNMFRIEMRYAQGRADYYSDGTGTDDNELQTTFETRGLAGYDIPVGQSFRLTPYLGFGYRYLLDNAGGVITTTGAYGYNRESNYFYIPVGMEVNENFGKAWALTLRGEYDYLIWGKQYSHLEDVTPSYNTLTNNQNHGFGARTSVRLTKKEPSFDIFVEPYLRYWHINKSEISTITYSGVAIGYGLEPKNDTAEWGIKFGIRY